MTEYKKAAPKLIYYHFKNEEEQKKFKMPDPNIETWLAGTLERLDNIYKWEEYHRKSRWFNKKKTSLQKEIEDMRDHIRKAWDLVPDDKTWRCPRCNHEQDAPDEIIIICKECYDTFSSKIQICQSETQNGKSGALKTHQGYIIVEEF